MNYQLIKELGSGSFGTTYLAVDQEGNQYAIKSISVERVKMFGMSVEEIHKEIDTLIAINNKMPPEYAQYVIKYYESFSEFTEYGEFINIVMEYAEGITMEKYVVELKEAPVIGELWPIMLQLMTGLEYIHKAGYAHRDIKPGNIMISDSGQIKYIDFGLACRNYCSMFKCTTDCGNKAGTTLFMPPEIFDSRTEKSLKNSKAHDVWSLCCVFYQLTGGQNSFPFVFNPKMTEKEFIASIMSQIYVEPVYTKDDGRTNIFIDTVTKFNINVRPTVKMMRKIFVDNILATVF